MTNFMQHASRLAMIAVLGAAPLAATAQDATKPASDEATAEAVSYTHLTLPTKA